MNTLLFNRDASGNFTLPQDNLFQIVPVGEYPNSIKGAKPGERIPVMQVIDAEAVGAIVENFNNDSRSKNFPGLLIDFDHFSYDIDKPTEAAGWINKLEARPDGVWGSVKWSAEGEAALKNGRYRLISPTLDRTKVDDLGGGRLRPRRLESAGLTNSPKMRGMEPLSNRDYTTKEENMDHKSHLLALLGLAAAATDPEIQAAFEKSKTDGEALKNRAKTLEDENTVLKNRLVKADLEPFKNRIKPGDEAKWEGRLMANRDDTLEILGQLPERQGAPASAPMRITSAEPMHNRSTCAQPIAAVSDSDQKAALQNRAVNEYKLANRCSFEEAWESLRRSKPELFQ